MLIERILRAGETANESSKGLNSEATSLVPTYRWLILGRVGDWRQVVCRALLRQSPTGLTAVVGYWSLVVMMTQPLGMQDLKGARMPASRGWRLTTGDWRLETAP